MSKLYMSFSGGIADENLMNFYDAGRFIYGAARFLNTVEALRAKEHVPFKITKKYKSDLLIGTAKPGSWWIDVAALAIPAVTDAAIKVPFDVMIAYAMDLLFKDRTKPADVAVALSKQETERARIQLDQERERTRQMQIMADVSGSGDATVRQTLDILKYALENNISANSHGENASVEKIGELAKETEAKIQRKEFLEPYADELAKIPADKENALTDRLRSPLIEMTQPLEASATSFNFGIVSNDNEKLPVLANITKGAALDITSLEVDDRVTSIIVKMKAYDWEGHNGKLRHTELMIPLPFSILRDSLTEVEPFIRSKKEGEEFEVAGYYVRDKNKNIKSIRILRANEIDEQEL